MLLLLGYFKLDLVFYQCNRMHLSNWLGNDCHRQKKKGGKNMESQALNSEIKICCCNSGIYGAKFT